MIGSSRFMRQFVVCAAAHPTRTTTAHVRPLWRGCEFVLGHVSLMCSVLGVMGINLGFETRKWYCFESRLPFLGIVRSARLIFRFASRVQTSACLCTHGHLNVLLFTRQPAIRSRNSDDTFTGCEVSNFGSGFRSASGNNGLRWAFIVGSQPLLRTTQLEDAAVLVWGWIWVRERNTCFADGI